MLKWFSFVILLSYGIFLTPCLAQWKSDSTTNTPVCIANGIQQSPQACSDGSNGVIVVWEDFRNSDWDIYTQKLNADGIAQWTANGIKLCASTTDQTSPIICSDGSGGAYVVWKDNRTSANGIDIYAQHINADGSLGYGNSGTGIAVAQDAATPDHLAICPDGKGNAFVAWEDSRTSITPASTRPDIWMNKLTPNGAVWGGASGIQVIGQILHQTNPKLVDDDSGGCYLVWENRSLPISIWGTRVNQNGSVLWGTTGVAIFGGSAQTRDDSKNPSICRDGTGLCVSWEQVNSSNSSKGWNILANRLQKDGSLVWGTTYAAPEISTDWLGDQVNSIVFSDDSANTNGVSGLLVVYEDYSGTHDIVMTRLLPDGANIVPAPPHQLFSVCRANADQTFPKAVKTGNGELLIVWNDKRLSNSTTTRSSIYAQICDKTPKRYLGPSPSFSTWGQAISNRSNSNADQVELVPRTNGGIAVWRDNRNGNYDIYAQLIFRNGTLPVELSYFSVETLENLKVLLNWETASEKDNAGFDIERRFISSGDLTNSFEVIGSYLHNSSLRGAGFSNRNREYSFIDNPINSGRYEYRLVDYSLDGEHTMHESKTVNVSDHFTHGEFSVGQNIPNPFNEQTIIPVFFSQNVTIDLIVTDVLGRIISFPYNNVSFEQGMHSLTINSNSIGLDNSGAYFYSLIIRDPQTRSVLWRMPEGSMMIKMKN